MSIMGTRVVRVEDPAFLSRGARYTDDLDLVGALHLTLVRSPLAHARIEAIDVGEARSAPGVVGVFTGADVDLEPALLFGGAGLLIAGALSSRFTPRPWWYSGLRQLLFGAVAAGITYAVGAAIGVAAS